jgi:peroxiredoxin
MEGQGAGAQLLGHLVPPCRKEIPAFSAMSGKYQDKGVQFVGISIDTADNVRDFSEHRVGYPLLIAEPSVVQLTEAWATPPRRCHLP